MYIILEGIDTAGKSTQLEYLKQNYPEAIFTKEPGGTEIGLEIRQMVLGAKCQSKIAEMFLFLADRAEHTEKIIKKNIDKMIISDRGFISGIAYAKEFDINLLKQLNDIALDGIYPNKIIMLELTSNELKYRLSQKVNDGIELRGIDYLLKIQSRMKKIITELNIPSLIIDASEDKEQIAQKIKDFING